MVRLLVLLEGSRDVVMIALTLGTLAKPIEFTSSRGLGYALRVRRDWAGRPLNLIVINSRGETSLRSGGVEPQTRLGGGYAQV